MYSDRSNSSRPSSGSSRPFSAGKPKFARGGFKKSAPRSSAARSATPRADGAAPSFTQGYKKDFSSPRPAFGARPAFKARPSFGGSRGLPAYAGRGQGGSRGGGKKGGNMGQYIHPSKFV